MTVSRHSYEKNIPRNQEKHQILKPKKRFSDKLNTTTGQPSLLLIKTHSFHGMTLSLNFFINDKCVTIA